MRWTAVLLGLAGCSDYALFGRKDRADTDTAASMPEVELTPEEVAPCLDALALPTGAAIDEGCAHEPQTGELDVVVEWSTGYVPSYPEYGHVLMAPVVGQLTDDDGNGRINERDDPDIVTVSDDDGSDGADHRGVLRRTRGTDGSIEMTVLAWVSEDLQVFPYRYSGVGLADLQGDGVPEILTLVTVLGGSVGDPSAEDTGPTAEDSGGDTGGEVVDVAYTPWMAPPAETCHLAAWSPEGEVVWVQTDVAIPCGGHAPAVADLEGDGAVEVIVGPHLFDGATGAPLWAASVGEGRYAAYPEVGYQSFAMDLDGDGIGEVLTGRAVYAATGSLRCEVDARLDDGFPAAADFDGDGLGEFVVVGNGRAHLHAADCALLAEWSLVGNGNGGPPTIADFDGDGQPEIGVAEASSYTVYEADGSPRWSMPVTDASSHATGSSVFDFDGDGRAEVVYADEIALWVFDGPTGAVRLHDGEHTSRTLHEYPVAADIDADGEIEIIVPQGGGHYGVTHVGLYALGSARGDWIGDRQVWNQHAFSLTNVEADLSVPAGAPANWPTYNTFRSGDVNPLSGGAAPDALGYAAVCTEACDHGMIEVVARLANGGMAEMRGEVPVSLYAEVGGERVYLMTMTALAALAPGEGGRRLSFTVDADLFPEGVGWVVFDDAQGAQQVRECHEDNNAVRLTGLVCP